MHAYLFILLYVNAKNRKIQEKWDFHFGSDVLMKNPLRFILSPHA